MCYTHILNWIHKVHTLPNLKSKRNVIAQHIRVFTTYPPLLCYCTTQLPSIYRRTILFFDGRAAITAAHIKISLHFYLELASHDVKAAVMGRHEKLT